MYCKNCGIRLSPDSTYCTNCGSRMISRADPVTPQVQKNLTNHYAQPSYPQQRQVQQPPQPYPQYRQAQRQPQQSYPQHRQAQQQPQPSYPQHRQAQRQPQQSYPQHRQVQQQPQQSANQAVKFYIDPKGVTVVNYKFKITDGNNNPLYTAEMLPSAMRYKMHICDMQGNEILLLQQSAKVTFTAMNFEIWQKGQMISNVIQKTHLTKYIYSLPELGLEANGDFFAFRFNITKGGNTIATISKKMMFWGDSYEVTVHNPAYSEIILGFVLAVQVIAIRTRRRR